MTIIRTIGPGSSPAPDELETAELEASENVLAENLAAADCGKLEPAVPIEMLANQDPSIPRALAIGYEFESNDLISTLFVGKDALGRAFGFIDAQRRERPGFEFSAIANHAARVERAESLVRIIQEGGS